MTPKQIMHGVFYGLLVFSLFFYSIVGAFYALYVLGEGEFGLGNMLQAVLMLPRGSLGLPEFGLTITIGVVRVFKALFIVPPILLDLLEQVTSLVFWCSSLVSQCAGKPSAANQANELEAAQKQIDDRQAALAALQEGTEEFREMQAKVDEALEQYDELLEMFKKANEKFNEKLKGYLGEERYNKRLARYNKRLKSLAKTEAGKEKVKASMSSGNKMPAKRCQISTAATQMTSEAI